MFITSHTCPLLIILYALFSVLVLIVIKFWVIQDFNKEKKTLQCDNITAFVWTQTWTKVPSTTWFKGIYCFVFKRQVMHSSLSICVAHRVCLQVFTMFPFKLYLVVTPDRQLLSTDISHSLLNINPHWISTYWKALHPGK
jgi:hypothetical protein